MEGQTDRCNAESQSQVFEALLDEFAITVDQEWGIDDGTKAEEIRAEWRERWKAASQGPKAEFMSGDRKPSVTKRGGYQGSSDPGEPMQLMQPQTRSLSQSQTARENLSQLVSRERQGRYLNDPLYHARVFGVGKALEAMMIHEYHAQRSEETWEQALRLAFIAVDAADAVTEHLEANR